MSTHHPHDLFENRHQFQLERMILFSDAVFAIAITLLVIEIRAPEMEKHTEHNLKHALLYKIPEFVGFLISFVIIGQFWVSHHSMFGYVQRFDRRLLWLNLHMLFWIVLVPFTSALQTNYFFDIAWLIYSVNLFMIALSSYFLWRHITNPKSNLSYLAGDTAFKKYAFVRTLTLSFVFLFGALFALINDIFFDHWLPSMISRCSFSLIFPALKIVGKKYKPKQKDQPV